MPQCEPEGAKGIASPCAVAVGTIVSDLSLDHELGDDKHGTGYDMLLWIEEAVASFGFRPPEISIHSANPAARQRLAAALRTIAARRKV